MYKEFWMIYKESWRVKYSWQRVPNKEAHPPPKLHPPKLTWNPANIQKEKSFWQDHLFSGSMINCIFFFSYGKDAENFIDKLTRCLFMLVPNWLGNFGYYWPVVSNCTVQPAAHSIPKPEWEGVTGGYTWINHPQFVVLQVSRARR